MGGGRSSTGWEELAGDPLAHHTMPPPFPSASAWRLELPARGTLVEPLLLRHIDLRLARLGAVSGALQGRDGGLEGGGE